jgi:hypothetical protein
MNLPFFFQSPNLAVEGEQWSAVEESRKDKSIHFLYVSSR